MIYEQFNNIGSYIEKNPIADRLLDSAIRIIGELSPVINSGNKDLDISISKAWRIESRNDYIAKEPLWDMLGDAIRQALIFGDALVIHRFDDSGRYVAKVIENRMWVVDEDGNVAVDDVIIPKNGYSILRFERNGVYRGKSAFYSAIKWLNNIDEILANYQEVIKISSKVAFKRTTQAQDVAQINAIFDDESSNNIDEEINKTTQEMASRMAIAGGTINLPEGQDIQILKDDRPSPDQMALVEFLLQCICHSFGLPPEVAFDLSSLRGANNRLRVAEINKYASEKRSKLIGVCSAIWVRWVQGVDAYKTATQAEKSKILAVEWRGSAPLTVDESRQGQQAIALVNAGLMTRQAYYAQEGLDYLQVADQLAYEAKIFAQNQQENDTPGLI